MARRGTAKLAGAVARGIMKPLENVLKDGEELEQIAKKAAKTVEKDVYRRPKGYRKGVRDKVWKTAKDEEGKVKDPLTNSPMKKDDAWDMGHKPGYEFRKHQASARRRNISRKEFLDEHNDPSHYQPELPSSNQGHAGEDFTNDYLGP